jgi:hypothetical protein
MLRWLNLKKDPSPALQANSPTRGESSSPYDAFLVSPEERSAWASPLPLWESSTNRAAIGRVRDTYNFYLNRDELAMTITNKGTNEWK